MKEVHDYFVEQMLSDVHRTAIRDYFSKLAQWVGSFPALDYVEREALRYPSFLLNENTGQVRPGLQIPLSPFLSTPVRLACSLHLSVPPSSFRFPLSLSPSFPLVCFVWLAKGRGKQRNTNCCQYKPYTRDRTILFLQLIKYTKPPPKCCKRIGKKIHQLASQK